MNIYLGINLPAINKFRIDVRRSIVQYYDNTRGGLNYNVNFFTQLSGNLISQRVDSLKKISQLSFRYNNYVFEIEIPNSAGRLDKITILLTNLETYESRLLQQDEFIVDTGNTWTGLFDDFGNLIGQGVLQIPYIDLTRLCSLSKDIIILAQAHYIRRGYSGDQLINELVDIMRLVCKFDNIIATQNNNHYTHQDIINWFEAGRPLN